MESHIRNWNLDYITSWNSWTFSFGTITTNTWVLNERNKVSCIRMFVGCHIGLHSLGKACAYKE
jgi:hypothetical protein